MGVTRIKTMEDLRRSLGETIQGVYHDSDDVVIHRNGKPVAALVPLHRFEALERSKERLWELIQKNWEANKDADPAEVEAAVQQAIDEVRAESRRELPRI